MTSLTNKQKSEMFRDLAKVSAFQAGVRAGLDKHYKNKWSLIAFVRRIQREVQETPQKFGISQDTIEMVNSSFQERKATKVAVIGQEMAVMPEAMLADLDVKSLVEGASKKSLMLLHRKMDMLGDSKKKLQETSVSALAQVVGIMFDKRQITKGEATEHIEMRAKVDVENKTPEQNLDFLLRMRENMLTGDESDKSSI